MNCSARSVGGVDETVVAQPRAIERQTEIDYVGSGRTVGLRAIDHLLA